MAATGWDFSPGVVLPTLVALGTMGAACLRYIQRQARLELENAARDEKIAILWNARMAEAAQALHHDTQPETDGLLDGLVAGTLAPQQVGQLQQRLDVIAAGGTTEAQREPARLLLLMVRVGMRARVASGLPAHVDTTESLAEDARVVAATAAESETGR